MSSEHFSNVVLAVGRARENIQLIERWADGRDLASLKADTLVRYAIERAFIAIDSAIRDIPGDLLARHGIPAGMIAGFRNALAHTYEDILDERVILTIRQDLPLLDGSLAALERELAPGSEH